MVINGIDTEKLGWTGPMPALAGQSRGDLLVIGGARCVWDDLKALGDDAWAGDRMVINDIGAHYHGLVQHWVSLHPDYFFPGFLKYRLGHNYANRAHVRTHSNKPHDGVEVVWPMPSAGGSSGLYGVYIGLLLGYSRIVVAGMPLDGQGHYFDPPWVNQSQFGRPDLLVWQWARDNVFQGRVTSMSGLTRELLGAPQ